MRDLSQFVHKFIGERAGGTRRERHRVDSNGQGIVFNLERSTARIAIGSNIHSAIREKLQRVVAQIINIDCSTIIVTRALPLPQFAHDLGFNRCCWNVCRGRFGCAFSRRGGIRDRCGRPAASARNNKRGEQNEDYNSSANYYPSTQS